MTDRSTLDAIAERYGAIIPPDLTVNVIPKGTSALPYPVWREAKGNTSAGLYIPDGEKHFRAAMWNHVPKPKKPKPPKAAKPAPKAKVGGVSAKTADLLKPLHAAGMTNAGIAAAVGKTPKGVKELIRRMGLSANRKRKTNNGDDNERTDGSKGGES